MLDPNVDNGGSPIISYSIQIRDATLNSTFTTVATLTSPTTTFTLNQATNGLIEGDIYSIRWYATNAFGSGPVSDEITSAVVEQLAAPSSIIKVESLSSTTSINVMWTPVLPNTSPGGDILGY